MKLLKHEKTCLKGKRRESEMKSLYLLYGVEFRFGKTRNGNPAVYLRGMMIGTGMPQELIFTLPDKGPGRHRFHEFVRDCRCRFGVAETIKRKDYDRICQLLNTWAKYFQVVLMIEGTTENGYPRYELDGVFENPPDGVVIDYKAMKRIN